MIDWRKGSCMRGRRGPVKCLLSAFVQVLEFPFRVDRVSGYFLGASQNEKSNHDPLTRTSSGSKSGVPGLRAAFFFLVLS